MIDEPESPAPKAFISYSWTSEEHRNRVKDLADRLIANGVNVLIDIYDTKEGDDLNSYMEKMVNDDTVSHVLIICDKEYQRKANARQSGVGTESLIISEQLYRKVEQSKFIPVIFEVDTEGKATTPTFCSGRKYLDFSSFELENENWESLIRLLYNKPLYEKPKLGTAPAYITTDSNLPNHEIRWKFEQFKNALLNNKRGISFFRAELFDECYTFADNFRPRKRINSDVLPQKIVDDCNSLVIVRDSIIDWLLLEITELSEDELTETIIPLLEKFLTLKYRPEELDFWNDSLGDAHSIFLYSMFIYIVTILVQKERFHTLHQILQTSYLLPEPKRSGRFTHDRFPIFQGQSIIINSILSEEKKYYSPSAELIRRQVTRKDVTFKKIIETELLLALMSGMIGCIRWMPGTLYYVSVGTELELFVRAKSHRFFEKLAIVLGVSTGDELRQNIKSNRERFNHLFKEFWHHDIFEEFFCLEELDTLP